MALTNVPSPDDTKAPSTDALQKENEELKTKLKAYRSLEEELMAQKVFENAKKKLLVWLTLGGLGTVLLALFGFRQVEDYTQALVKNKVDSVAQQQLSDLIQQHVSTTVAAKEQYINLAITEAVGRYVVSQRLTYSVAPTSTVASEPLLFDATRRTVDYTASMTPVRDLGQEGSVVGFAVGAALEYQIFQKTNKPVQISPRYIYYVARQALGTSKEDSGAKIEDAIKALTRDGAVTEAVWPYKWGEFANEPPKALAVAEKYRATAARTLKSIDDVRAALQKYGPVVAGIAIYGSSMSASTSHTGYIPDPSPKDSVIGGFAICIVGYDDEKARLKFKNAWGATWGDHGYGYISYRYFAKLSSDCWAITL